MAVNEREGCSFAADDVRLVYLWFKFLPAFAGIACHGKLEGVLPFGARCLFGAARNRSDSERFTGAATFSCSMEVKAFLPGWVDSRLAQTAVPTARATLIKDLGLQPTERSGIVSRKMCLPNPHRLRTPCFDKNLSNEMFMRSVAATITFCNSKTRDVANETLLFLKTSTIPASVIINSGTPCPTKSRPKSSMLP